MTKTTTFIPMARTFAIVCGAVFWAALFAFVGAMTGHAWSGAACGTVIGAVIGYGFVDRGRGLSQFGGQARSVVAG